MTEQASADIMITRKAVRRLHLCCTIIDWYAAPLYRCWCPTTPSLPCAKVGIRTVSQPLSAQSQTSAAPAQ